jgi:hypothetical protein
MIEKHWTSYLAKNRPIFPFLVLLIVCIFGAGQPAAADNLTLSDAGGTADSDDDSSQLVNGCSNIRTGRLPLIDMLRTVYEGFTGGLYPSSNEVPEQHLQMGMTAAQSIEPLSKQGQPNSSGKIVLLALGMSNTKQEFDKFMELTYGQTSDAVVLENGAKAGYDAAAIADPTSEYWAFIDDHLISRDLSRLQVQAIWIKQAIAGESDPFPQDAQQLRNYLRSIVLIAKNRYPNAEAIYFSSRTYGGYAEPNSASPEPWAYQGGFAVKWLIESQINGSDPALSYANAPWLAWGPYLWADGMDPRSDGLFWKCNDFEDDGTHPSPAGELKVATRLLDFFVNDPTTTWFPINSNQPTRSWLLSDWFKPLGN